MKCFSHFILGVFQKIDSDDFEFVVSVDSQYNLKSKYNGCDRLTVCTKESTNKSQII